MKKNIWTNKDIAELFAQPFFALINIAYQCHQQNFSQNDMELCTLCSIKTGTCPEDCAYCPQSGHYNTGLKREKLLDLELILMQARIAKQNGAKRFCMGAAWRSPPKKDLPKVIAIIKAVKDLGLETCVTLGMLDMEQALQFKEVGLDYYNHNLDTSPEYYKKIISTRTYVDRLDTLKNVASAGIKICCGGILGMGETREDRINFLLELSKLQAAPDSIPINQLIPIPGTPLALQQRIDAFEFIKTIAVARIMFPKARIRLAAGREDMEDTLQAWCFMAGVNSIFFGDKLLTAGNTNPESDINLLEKLGYAVG
jgi:biotin synthase